MEEKIYPIVQKEEFSKLICFDMCGITYPDPHYTISRPASQFACIEYVEAGTGVVNVGGKQFCPSEGDSYFLPTEVDQFYYSNSEFPWKKYFVNISGSLISLLGEGYHLSGKFHFQGLNLKDELCRIIALAKKQDEGHTGEMVAILNGLLFRMHCYCGGEAVGDDTANRMRDFLNTKIESNFQMEELCHYISRSESQTIKIFKKAFGITPYCYLLDKKTELAKKLLRNTNLLVKEIALRLHFADEYYFSNVFKQKCGQSPSAYRRADQHKKDGSL